VFQRLCRGLVSVNGEKGDMIDLEVFVLCHPRKVCTTTQLLQHAGVTHTMYVNEDSDLPFDHAEYSVDRSWRPSQRDYAVRQYRAMYGHTQIHKRSKAAITLVFEDDVKLGSLNKAYLHRAMDTCHDVFETYPDIQAISFHGRNLSPTRPVVSLPGMQFSELQTKPLTEEAQIRFLGPLWKVSMGLTTPPDLKWHEGCLMYAVNESGRKAWADADLRQGWPCDLFLVNKLNTLVVTNSPVMHNETGSLMTRPLYESPV